MPEASQLESAQLEGQVEGSASPTFFDVYGDWVVWGIAFAVLVTGFIVLGWLFFGRRQEITRTQLRLRGVIIAVVFVVLILGLILSLPVSDNLRNGLLGLVGLTFAALITLGSTTIFANFMAGVMMYHVRSFRPGDYIRIGEHAGRVSQKGLFHVEIQTEDRDLVTLPNSYLITNPLRVVRTSGTIVWCDLSLGYDVAHAKVEPLLVEAAEKTGLRDPFVQVRNLGDFSVTYRAAGLLEDTKKLISTRSDLREHILDTLHGAGIEIVSPTFMNQRRVEEAVIPELVQPRPDTEQTNIEDVAFDKAEDAERIERVRETLQAAKEKLKSLESDKAQCDAKAEPDRNDSLCTEIDHQRKLIDYLSSRLARLEKIAAETTSTQS